MSKQANFKSDMGLEEDPREDPSLPKKMQC